MEEPAPAAIPQPQRPPSMIGTLSSQQLLEALDLAVSMRWSIEDYERMAGAEKTHVTRITQMKQMFTEAAAVIQRGSKKLRDDTVELAVSWHDKNFQPAFESPVNSYMTQLKASSDKLGGDAQPGAGHISALTGLETEIPTTYDAVKGFLGTNKTEKDNLRGLRQALADAIKNSQPASGTETLVANSIGKLMDSDQQGFDALQTLDTSLAKAAGLVKAAVDGHTLTGPAAGSAPGTPKTAPAGPGGPSGPGGGPSAPGGGPSAEQPGGQQPGGEQPGGEQPGGEQPGGAQPGGEQPGGEQPGGDTGTTPDDTGLSGMPTTTIPPPTTPDLPSPTPNTPSPTPSTHTPVPVGSTGGPTGLTGVGGLGRGGGGRYGGGGPNPPGGGGGNTTVQPAARQLTATPGVGTGDAPALSGLATGSPSARGGNGMGGMPPMMPPMMPGGGAGNGKPKPGTAQPSGTGRNRPAGATPGVPAGLRGRTGDGPSARPASRRARRNGPESVEMLDSELWDVERTDPAAERTERAERAERNERTERMRMKGI